MQSFRRLATVMAATAAVACVGMSARSQFLVWRIQTEIRLYAGEDRFYGDLLRAVIRQSDAKQDRWIWLAATVAVPIAIVLLVRSFCWAMQTEKGQ